MAGPVSCESCSVSWGALAWEGPRKALAPPGVTRWTARSCSKRQLPITTAAGALEDFAKKIDLRKQLQNVPPDLSEQIWA